MERYTRKVLLYFNKINNNSVCICPGFIFCVTLVNEMELVNTFNMNT